MTDPLTGIITYEFNAVLMAFMLTIGAAAATMIGGLSVLRASATNPRLLAFGLAFAGGAMVYISLVEIFVKSNLAFAEIYDAKPAYVWATILFFCGVALLAFIDRMIPNPHNELTKLSTPDMDRKHLARVGLMAAIAITVHNFPEGMATFFATLDNPVVGAPLAIAIAVHNIPEGVSIAIPVYYATNSKQKALIACFISALAEPVGAALGYFILAPYLTPFVFGSVFGIIAGAMVFLSLDELLPSAKRYAAGHDAVYGMIIGMVMVALSLVLFK